MKLSFQLLDTIKFQSVTQVNNENKLIKPTQTVVPVYALNQVAPSGMVPLHLHIIVDIFTYASHLAYNEKLISCICQCIWS